MKFRVICYVEESDLAAIVQMIAPLGEVTVEPTEAEFISTVKPARQRKSRQALGTTLREVATHEPEKH